MGKKQQQQQIKQRKHLSYFTWVRKQQPNNNIKHPNNRIATTKNILAAELQCPGNYPQQHSFSSESLA